MEKQQQLAVNGQAVYQADFNTMGESAGLADDRVFAELVRLAPYNGAVVKGIIPFSNNTITGTLQQTVSPNSSTGSVLVRPFRAFVGSRTSVSSNPLKNWRDIRSGVFAQSSDGVNLGYKAPITANSSGNPRWDLVYASVVPDAPGDSAPRKIKDPSSQAISSSSQVLNLVCAVTVAVAAGTPGASPNLPATPSDGGGAYIIPLAYVRVPNGFGGSSAVQNVDILDAQPTVTGCPPMGIAMRPANSLYTAGGSTLTNARVQTWGSAGTRPSSFLPPDMTGGESLIVPLDLTDASQSNWSHADGVVVDNSRDWRWRFFRWSLYMQTGVKLASDSNGSFDSASVPCGGKTDVSDPDKMMVGLGQSFTRDSAIVTSISSDPDPYHTVAYVDQASDASLPSGSGFGLFVRWTDGALVFKSLTNSPLRSVFIWVDASAPMANF